MVIFTEMVERWNLDYSFQNWSWPGRGKAGFLFNETVVECCSRLSEYMIHHHWVISKIHRQFFSSDAITCKHSLTAKYEVTCVSYNVPVMFMFRIAYPDRYHITTPSVGSKWPFLWWRWSKNWRPFTPALACQTTITLKTCIPGRNSIIYFCSTFPISFLTYEWFWWHWCQGLLGLTVPIIRDQKIKAIWGPLTVISRCWNAS